MQDHGQHYALTNCANRVYTLRVSNKQNNKEHSLRQTEMPFTPHPVNCSRQHTHMYEQGKDRIGTIPLSERKFNQLS